MHVAFSFLFPIYRPSLGEVNASYYTNAGDEEPVTMRPGKSVRIDSFIKFFLLLLSSVQVILSVRLCEPFLSAEMRIPKSVTKHTISVKISKINSVSQFFFT